MVDRPLTVVQMLPELESGGVERGTLEFGNYLVQHGHRSIVISSGGRLVAQLESEGSEHFSWGVGNKSLLTLRYILKLRKFLIQQKVDILHLRSRVPAWVGYLAWKSLPEQSRPRLVTTFHGFYTVNRFSSIMAKGEKVVAISKSVVRHIQQEYGISPERIELIYRGLDESKFAPSAVPAEVIKYWQDRWGLPEGERPPIIMLPGRLTRLKGHDVFIKALNSIKDLDWLAVCVGDADDNPRYRNELQQLLISMQLKEKVKFVGFCNNMPAAYLLADIVVSATSTKPEAFGRIAVEAQAMGKPVIATAHGGSLETVLPGTTGWLVKPNDPQSLADALREALNDQHQLQKFGENGIKWVRENFSTVRMCEKKVSLFRDLLEQKEGISRNEKLLIKTSRKRSFKKKDGKLSTVVQMVPELESGGVERGTLEMAKYLVQQGYRSIVISGGGRLVSQLESEGSEHILWAMGKKSPLTLRYILKLRKFLTQQKVDILHLRSRVPAWVGYLTWKSLSEQSRPRLVTTFHGFYSVNSYSAIMTKGEKVIAISKSIEDHIKTTYQIPDERIILIQEGIDLDYFNPGQVLKERITGLSDEWGISQETKPLIMLPGRITRWKGHEVFMQSLSLLKDIEWRAVCVGDPAEKISYYNELVQLSKELHLDDRLKFVGQCDDMPAAYLLSDVVVSASTAEAEAFGRIAVEAQALGRPVIATAHGGSLETVIPGKTGWLVPPNNPEILAEALKEAINNASKRREFGENGIKWVSENFSTAIMCEKTVSLYSNLLK